MIRACLYLLAGNYALQLSSFAIDSDLIAFAFVAFILTWFPGKTRLLLFFVVGVAMFDLTANEIISSRIASQYVGDSIVARVRIVDFPKQSGRSFSLVADTIDNPHLPQRIRISWYEPQVAIKFGDVWQLELRLRRPRGSSNPGLFDYEAWLLRERVAATGYVVQSHRNHLLRSGEPQLLGRIRQKAVDRLAAVVGETERAAVLAAISVGARHLVTNRQWDRYARTGTSHLMAISGLHVGLAATGGYFLAVFIAGLIRLRGNQHFVATVAAVSVAMSYALVSGLAVPAQRASLMIAIVSAVVLRRRQLRPAILVATACAVIVLLSPLASMAPGFKLSFAAVLVLLWQARRHHDGHSGKLFLKHLFAARQLGVMQLMLLFGLLPLTVLIFGRIVVVAPVVNLLVVPVFSLVTVPCTLIGLILDGWAQPVGDKVLLVAASSLGLAEKLIAAAAQISWASIAIPEIKGAGWIYIGLPLLWVLCPPGWPCRSLVLPALVALCFYLPARPDGGCADIDVLDVGQGLSIVVTTHSNIVVFDTGPAYRGGGNAAESLLIPFLEKRGISRVDTLIVSHADLDHAGGVESLLAGIDVRELRSGELLTATAGRKCIAGDYWEGDGIRFSFLHPPPDTHYQGNDASCVLLIEAGNHRALLTGDIEQPAEADLVHADSLPSVDLVVVPHHGSRTSSGLPFVAALSPTVAVVSAGYGNRWGLPKDDIVGRWRAVGAEVLGTAESGAVSIRLCRQGGLVSMSRHRDSQRRIWTE